MKFLGDLLNENLNWKEHIKYTENKITAESRTTLQGKILFRKKCRPSSLLFIFYIPTSTMLT